MEAKTPNRYNVPTTQWNNLDNEQQSLFNRITEQSTTNKEEYLKGIELSTCRNTVDRAFDRIVQGVALVAIQEQHSHA